MTPEPTGEVPAPTKPHFLRRVQIRNYKSIAFCDVTLEPLTILVGRNATGKSNFLDALGFLRDVVVKGVREAVSLHGGRDAVLSRTANTQSITIRVETAFEAQDQAQSWEATFAIQVGMPANAAAILTNESMEIHSPLHSHFPGYEVHAGRVRWTGEAASVLNGAWSSVDRLYLEATRGAQPFQRFYQCVEQFFAYSFSPEVMRLPQLPTPGEFLKSDGSNLASVYKSTMAADPAAAKRATRYLNAVARSVEFAGVLSAGGYEIMEFDTSGNVDDWNGPPRKADRFPAASMSDGTLRAFAAVMAAFQTVAPYGSPSLVAIEEPETALHPAAMRALVAALDEATWRTQILITTHSPDLLDAEEVKPANLRVVELVEGHTVIGPVDAANAEVVERGLTTLGGLERDRQLIVDLDDRDRQAELAGRERVHS